MSELITVDAGHGGFDNGASLGGRLEKDDNLRLALEVAKQLEAQGQQVQLTRDSDVFISLKARADMANAAGSGLFVSLHRCPSIERPHNSNGVEACVYTAASPEIQRMAAKVLACVAETGVQAGREVSRGNYSVLRRSRMPAMLLEIGCIAKDEDNRIFDENLVPCATGIAKGILEGLGKPYAPTAVQSDPTVAAIQHMLNDWFSEEIPEDGVYGFATKKGLIRAVQSTLNQTVNANLKVDGIFGGATRAYIPDLREGSQSTLVYLLQAALYLNGYSVGDIDGIYGPMTRQAVVQYQQDKGLKQDGIAGKETFGTILG